MRVHPNKKDSDYLYSTTLTMSPTMFNSPKLQTLNFTMDPSGIIISQREREDGDGEVDGDVDLGEKMVKAKKELKFL